MDFFLGQIPKKKDLSKFSRGKKGNEIERKLGAAAFL